MPQHVDIQSNDNAPPEHLLATEWLLTNGRGSYASSTVVGTNTRKYHGLLVSAVRPPGERFVLLAGLADEVVLDGEVFPLACFEFDGSFHPRGDRFLVAFDCDKSAGSVAFTYQLGSARLVRRIALARGADALAVRYELVAQGNRELLLAARVRIMPFLAYRHYHANRHATGQPALHATFAGGTLRLGDPGGGLPALRIVPVGGRFSPAGDWWYRFFYRAEADRGEDPWEDLFTPGRFELAFDAGGAAELRAAVEPVEPVSFAQATIAQRKHFEQLEPRAEARGWAARGARGIDSTHLRGGVTQSIAAHPRAGVPNPDGSGLGAPAARGSGDLLLAADDFIVHLPGGGATVLAGYHWFADWGRDAFIALPGLLLAGVRAGTRGRPASGAGPADLARGVLLRFAGAIRNGLVPNRFSDVAQPPSAVSSLNVAQPPSAVGELSAPRAGRAASIPCDYNSVDASLWFIRAAFAWADATGRWDQFDAGLLGPVRAILDAYHRGTDYGIRVDADGLLTAGSPDTQLTWMDAMVAGVAVTPRAGKPVEANALYGHALRLAGERLEALGDPSAGEYRDRLVRWRDGFVAVFPSPRGGLYDCIGLDGRPDDAIRPNQVLAVSLGDSPLPEEVQRQVVELAREKLLTPFGLRSLAPGEPGYRGRYAGRRHERDAAYHQGTVWAWLIGPFVEAYLRVNGFSRSAKRQAGSWLEPLMEHLHSSAGLGQISEIFDGDPPHTPRGCIAQVWSVAEVLRACALVGWKS